MTCLIEGPDEVEEVGRQVEPGAVVLTLEPFRQLSSRAGNSLKGQRPIRERGLGADRAHRGPNEAFPVAGEWKDDRERVGATNFRELLDGRIDVAPGLWKPQAGMAKVRPEIRRCPAP